jgi:CDP-diacylglycerol--glycerol-3-phosphate 3-phosphatidyltransferase
MKGEGITLRTYLSALFARMKLGSLRLPVKLRHIRLRELFYPSNLLTIARLLMLPTVLRALRRPDGRWEALATVGVAMATDAIDGPIARRRQEVSELGKLLDPIADKLMVDTTAFTLSQTRQFPWWATALLIGRDLVILLGGALVFRRRAEITTAHVTGKATTVALTGAMLLYIADGPRSGRPALYLALIPFTASLIAYMRSFLRIMRRGKEIGD